jgi:hypothetical protein
MSMLTRTSALRMDDKTARTWDRLDIAYMSAICAPHADVETLKLMNDWNGWVFAFDDRELHPRGMSSADR